MPTVIDSLLVTLGLKADDFHKEKQKVESGLQDLTKSATKFLAVIGGTYEIKKFIQNQIEANSALDRLSQNLNTSAQNLQTWSNAAELAGGSGQGLQGSLMMLSRAQTELKLTGQSALVPYLSALGVSLADVHGRAIPVIEVLQNIGEKLMTRSGGDRQTAFNMGSMMGFDPGTLNAILQGREALESFMKRMGELNSDMNAQSEEATKLRNSIFWVSQTFERFGRDLFRDVSPALEKVLEYLQNFADWCRENEDFLEAFFTVISAGITLITVAAIPLSATVAAFVALAAVMAAAWQDFQVWKNGGDSLLPWAATIDVVSSAFGRLSAFVTDVFYRVTHLGAALMALKDGNYSMAYGLLNDVGTGKPIDNGPGRQQFINSAAAQLNVPPAAIDAQLRLETGIDGSKAIGNYNYGNVKAGKGYTGSVVAKDVTEISGAGGRYTERSNFRSFSSPQEAAADYAAQIKRNFPNAVGAQTAEAFARGLQAGGYATDPNYVSKVSNIAAGIPGASSVASGGAAAPNVANNRTTNMTVGDVTIQTQATDGPGVAKDFAKSLNYFATAQSNAGLR